MSKKVAIFAPQNFTCGPLCRIYRQMKSKTDIELMTLTAGRDEAAFAELMERHRTRLQRMAYALLPDRAAADDAVQETFIRLWTHARRFNPTHTVATWLCTICCRRCYDELRRHRRLRIALPLPEPTVQADDMEATELAELLRRAVALLPPKQRIVYQLREVEGLSADETAAATGQSPEQVKANLWAARNTVREKLKRYGIQ